jgi:hypothetical protein
MSTTGFIVNEDFLKIRNGILLHQVKDDIELILQRIERLETRVHGIEESKIRGLK